MGDIADSHFDDIDWFPGKPRPPKPRGPGPCPRCGAPTKLKTGPFGSFYGCTNYPKCKGNRDPLPGLKKLDKLNKLQNDG